jgi:deoxyxylulose-5-phosphate synthase
MGGECSINIRTVGIPDVFVEHGSQSILRKLLGLDEEGIFLTASSLLQHTKLKH